MVYACNWCGIAAGQQDSLKPHRDWARKISLCDKCQSCKKENRCVRCNQIKPNQILINGNCEDCYSEMIAYREREQNNNLGLIGNSNIKQDIDSKENKLWRSELFSTSRVQMHTTDSQLGEVENTDLIGMILRESTEVDQSCRVGYAMAEYGISHENKQQLMRYSEELEVFLDRYSKHLVLPERFTNNKRYTLIFLDKAIDNMPLEKRVQLIGDGSHFLLAELDSSVRISDKKKNVIQTFVNRYITKFNEANSSMK